MCDQQSLRSACACAQSDQSLCLLLEYSMNMKLLTEHHLEFLSFKGGCTGSSEIYTCQNATLLEITCHGSYLVLYFQCLHIWDYHPDCHPIIHLQSAIETKVTQCHLPTPHPHTDSPPGTTQARHHTTCHHHPLIHSPALSFPVPTLPCGSEHHETDIPPHSPKRDHSTSPNLAQKVSRKNTGNQPTSPWEPANQRWQHHHLLIATIEVVLQWPHPQWIFQNLLLYFHSDHHLFRRSMWRARYLGSQVIFQHLSSPTWPITSVVTQRICSMVPNLPLWRPTRYVLDFWNRK